MSSTPNNNEYEYELRDITFPDSDPRGLVKEYAPVTLSEEVAIELNYARALNGDPKRLVKVVTY